MTSRLPGADHLLITGDLVPTNVALLTTILLGFSYGRNEYQWFDIATALAKVLGVLK